jgi:hypothetical protein
MHIKLKPIYGVVFSFMLIALHHLVPLRVTSWIRNSPSHSSGSALDFVIDKPPFNNQIENGKIYHFIGFEPFNEQLATILSQLRTYLSGMLAGMNLNLVLFNEGTHIHAQLLHDEELPNLVDKEFNTDRYKRIRTINFPKQTLSEPNKQYIIDHARDLDKS